MIPARGPQTNVNLEFKSADCVCLSTGASREAPVDNECFGQLGWPSKGCLGNFLGTLGYPGGDGKS